MPETARGADWPRHVVVYTDGACIGNPGPGGYGAILIHGSRRKELAAGYRRTTNNRMEMRAAIAALEALKEPCQVTIYTDSQYLRDAIELGWAKRWRANGWMRTKREAASNADLWARLLDLCDQHEVEFQWVRGHSGVPENERADRLALQAALNEPAGVDTGYEATSQRDRR